jgi:hypothetical protein
LESIDITPIDKGADFATEASSNQQKKAYPNCFKLLVSMEDR